MRIGIFGGTFDPPHLGHLILASEAAQQLSLDRVLFMLTPDPPHKTEKQITSVADRLKMLEAAIGDNPKFILSDVEIERPGPHYTVDTVRLLKKEFQEDELVYLMGGDTLKNLPINWYQPVEFVTICDQIGVMRRPQDEVDLNNIIEKLPELENKIIFVDAPLLEISSCEIRKRISEGSPYRYYLQKSVFKLIQRQGLYKDK